MKCSSAQLASHKKYYESHREEKRAYNADHRNEKRAYDATHYLENRDTILEKCAEFTEWLQILRTNNGCEDCGAHEGRLVHHHVDPETKKYEIAQMYSYSLDALEDELEKCVVLCESCHKKRHAAIKLLLLGKSYRSLGEEPFFIPVTHSKLLGS